MWEGYDENIIPRSPPELAIARGPFPQGSRCAGRESQIRNSDGLLFETAGKEEAGTGESRRRPQPGPATAGGRAASARELAAQAAHKGGRRHAEPAGGDITITGASLVQWTPAQSSFEVAQANPGLCAVLENAALRYAGGQAADARQQLEEGIENDIDTKLSVLAWLALFDLLQRLGDKAAFDRLALQYVVQFERSAPAWEAGEKPSPARRVFGGTVAVTGRLTAASATQIEGIRRAISRQVARGTARSRVGDRLRRRRRAPARQCVGRRPAGAGWDCSCRREPNWALRSTAAMKNGRAAGEGAWLLSLEILQWAERPRGVRGSRDRVCGGLRAFAAVMGAAAGVPGRADGEGRGAGGERGRRVRAGDAEVVRRDGRLAGAAVRPARRCHAAQQVIAVDMSEVERIDFVCAGALLNHINRIEAQRKAVQIVGASPIIRALLLLIGVSPRHFVKKPQ